MSKDELVQLFVERINKANSSNKAEEIKKIIFEIDELTYTKNGSSISNSDKIDILSGIKVSVITESVSVSEVFAQDNKDHLELINQAIRRLGGK